MDTTGYLPALRSTDPLYEIADYTELMRTALTAKTANVSLTSGNSAASGIVTQVTRQGVLVHLNGRIVRSAQGSVGSIPLGYRPARTVFLPATHQAGFLLIQIEPNGVISTPFDSRAGDMMLDFVYSCPASPLAP